MDSASHIERIKADGFTILERAIEPELVDALARYNTARINMATAVGEMQKFQL